MKREDVIQLARECGFSVGIGSPALPKFTALVEKAVAEEREACALAAEAERLTDGTNDPADVAYNNAVKHCTAAIRARKDNT
jgi:hypothetical protein